MTPLRNPLPVTVTWCPPPLGPAAGAIPPIPGGPQVESAKLVRPALGKRAVSVATASTRIGRSNPALAEICRSTVTVAVDPFNGMTWVPAPASWAGPVTVNVTWSRSWCRSWRINKKVRTSPGRATGPSGAGKNSSSGGARSTRRRSVVTRRRRPAWSSASTATVKVASGAPNRTSAGIWASKLSGAGPIWAQVWTGYWAVSSAKIPGPTRPVALRLTVALRTPVSGSNNTTSARAGSPGSRPLLGTKVDSWISGSARSTPLNAKVTVAVASPC